MIWAELHREAVARLRAAGIEGAERDAQRLADHVLGGAGRLRLFAGDSPDAGQAARFEAAIAARAGRQPVAQITGKGNWVCFGPGDASYSLNVKTNEWTPILG